MFKVKIIGKTLFRLTVETNTFITENKTTTIITRSMPQSLRKTREKEM